MTDSIQPSAGSDDSTESSRVVDVVKIKLTVIIDRTSGLLEWKCTGIAGVPARVVSQLGRGPVSTGDPAIHADLMSAALFLILQEHCEPF